MHPALLGDWYNSLFLSLPFSRSFLQVLLTHTTKLKLVHKTALCLTSGNLGSVATSAPMLSAKAVGSLACVQGFCVCVSLGYKHCFILCCCSLGANPSLVTSACFIIQLNKPFSRAGLVTSYSLKYVIYIWAHFLQHITFVYILIFKSKCHVPVH